MPASGNCYAESVSRLDDATQLIFEETISSENKMENSQWQLSCLCRIPCIEAHADQDSAGLFLIFGATISNFLWSTFLQNLGKDYKISKDVSNYSDGK
jgi:hypothetical protein